MFGGIKKYEWVGVFGVAVGMGGRVGECGRRIGCGCLGLWREKGCLRNGGGRGLKWGFWGFLGFFIIILVFGWWVF